MLRGFLMLLLSACMMQTTQADDFSHEAWDVLLKHHVVLLSAGKISYVDYAGMSADQDELRHYLDALSSISRMQFDAWPPAEQLAFLINAYNAWTVELIVRAWPDVQSIKDLGSWFKSPWKKRFIPLLEDKRSLDEIEHSLIRSSGRYNDPRIHFVVNCASVGCPALNADAYRGDQLDAQLERAVQRFLSDRKRNRLEGNTLKVSAIFKWYRADFEQGWRGADSLGEFLLLYRQSLELSETVAERLQNDQLDIEFLDYDWQLNAKE
jgi:hypothetical protein